MWIFRVWRDGGTKSKSWDAQIIISLSKLVWIWGPTLRFSDHKIRISLGRLIVIWGPKITSGTPKSTLVWAN